MRIRLRPLIFYTGGKTQDIISYLTANTHRHLKVLGQPSRRTNREECGTKCTTQPLVDLLGRNSRLHKICFLDWGNLLTRDENDVQSPRQTAGRTLWSSCLGSTDIKCMPLFLAHLYSEPEIQINKKNKKYIFKSVVHLLCIWKFLLPLRKIYSQVRHEVIDWLLIRNTE